MTGSAQVPAEAPPDCPLCPRLVAFRAANRQAQPSWHNGAVASFGKDSARLLIVGLAPGLRGANRTGRPFTGDYAGILLFETLHAFGWSNQPHGASVGDGLALRDCRISNAVKCLPPQNKPLPVEIANCSSYLAADLATLRSGGVMLALGRIAHDAALRALGLRVRDYPFGHNARHDLRDDSRDLVLFDSYHCSRYNTNTGRLTRDMFRSVFASIDAHFKRGASA